MFFFHSLSLTVAVLLGMEALADSYWRGDKAGDSVSPRSNNVICLLHKARDELGCCIFGLTSTT